MANLLINVDHVATLRNARGEQSPDPVKAASICEAAGADGIVFHLREDRRHITESDVRRLREATAGKLDFEMSTAEDVVGICIDTEPDLATLVPERRLELTTEGGLDVIRSRARLVRVIQRIKDAGIDVAIFVEPNLEQIQAAADVGADAIELHTGNYANARNEADRLEVLSLLADAAEKAHDLKMDVHAGHGLDYDNYPPLKASVPHLKEVSIGFAIIARALFDGLDVAVREMVKLVR